MDVPTAVISVEVPLPRFVPVCAHLSMFEPVAVTADAPYKNPPVNVPFPPGVVMTTSLDPTVPAGVTNVTDVAELTTTPVAATPPTVTPVAPVSAVPVIVTLVVPLAGPFDGEILVMAGKSSRVIVSVYVLVVVPSWAVTTTVMAFEPILSAIALDALPDMTVVPLTLTVAFIWLTVGVTVMDETLFATDAL